MEKLRIVWLILAIMQRAPKAARMHVFWCAYRRQNNDANELWSGEIDQSMVLHITIGHKCRIKHKRETQEQPSDHARHYAGARRAA